MLAHFPSLTQIWKRERYSPSFCMEEFKHISFCSIYFGKVHGGVLSNDSFFLSSYHPQQLFGMFKAKKYEIIFKAEH